MSAPADRRPERVDAVALRIFLDGEHREIREMIRGVISRPEFTDVDWPLAGDEYREQVMDWLQLLSSSGGTAMGFPSEFGGLDRVGGAVASFETLAHSDLSLLVKCGVQFGLFGGAVLHLGTRKHHERYLRAITSLELPGCFAMSEAAHGSNVQQVRTTATYDADAEEFVVDTPGEEDCKDYIGNAARDGRMAAVFAQLVVGGETHGVHCLVVPIRDKKGKPLDGIRIEDDGPKIGLNGVDNGRIWFDGVRVPRENLLDRYAQVSPEGEYTSAIESAGKRFFTMLGTLIQGRVCIAGASNSAAKNALVIATRYANRRRQFGPPDGDEVTLMSYMTHKLRLLPRIAGSYALHFAQVKLTADLHESFASGEDDRRVLESDAAGLKALSSWHARDVIQVCRECCGGAGYLAENRFAAMKADQDVFTTFEGDNVVLLQLVGKSLLTNYQHEFGSLDPIGTARFVASQVLETVGERTAVRELITRLADDLIPGRDEGELDHEVELALLQWRAEHILSSLARRLKAGIDDGGDPFEVFMATQDHVVAAGRAHIEHHVLECFTKAVEACPDEQTQHTLSRLCHLYALWLIVLDRGWFQEHGRLSSTRSKAVQKAGRALCTELAPQAEDLVAAFGVPPAAIPAPIAGF
jgi:acyl-CoA oxidase